MDPADYSIITKKKPSCLFSSLALTEGYNRGFFCLFFLNTVAN